MSNYIQCCPICGKTLTYKNVFCSDCRYSKSVNKNKNKELHAIYQHNEIAYKPVDLYISNHSKEYYENLSEQKCGTKDNWKEIFVEEELSKLSTFDREKYLRSCEKQKERDERKAYHEAHPEESKPYSPPPTLQPKCPTCASTNIQKISDISKATHALAFGLFSKTARSQFCCKNCGYKW